MPCQDHPAAWVRGRKGWPAWPSSRCSGEAGGGASGPPDGSSVEEAPPGPPRSAARGPPLVVDQCAIAFSKCRRRKNDLGRGRHRILEVVDDHDVTSRLE